MATFLVLIPPGARSGDEKARIVRDRFSWLALFLPVQNFLPRFPRSRVAGAVLLTIDLVWSFWLMVTMEMGEFAAFRLPLLIALPVGFFLVLLFVDEFLAVRALGILCLLAAEPLLDPPERRSGKCGCGQSPKVRFSPVSPAANSTRWVLPASAAPSKRSR